MAEDKVFKFRRVAAKLYSRNEDLQKKLRPLYEAPIIIAMKGDPKTGRKFASFCVASILKCPLIKEHDFANYEEKSEENQAKLWRKICNLAISQLTLGRSVVIDTELANQNDFHQLKELSEITQTRLAVFDCPVADAEKLWKSVEIYPDERDTILYLFPEFMEKPTSQYVNSTNFDMGEIPKILVEMETLWYFNSSVYNALKDLQAHIFPDFESQNVYGCDHLFNFTNIDDEYKRLCSQCMQLVSGSVYCCHYCRFIAHRTCSYLPESLSVRNNLSITDLILQYVDVELDAAANCICCKQLLTDSTSSQYYSSFNGLFLFDLDCLFLLPAKRSTMLHKHELLRTFSTGFECDEKNENVFSTEERKECDASIDEGTILYYCPECHIAFDMYCLWLPETVEFNRHRHPFKLSVVSKADSYPYYCDVCQNERDTERWIYNCAECDFPIHPRCIIKSPCRPTYLFSELLTRNKKTKDKLTETNFHNSSSHLSTERVKAKEFPSQHKPGDKELRLLFKEATKEIELPIIIATKGHSFEGGKLVTSGLAATLDCLFINADKLCEVTNSANESKQVCYQELSRIALSQLQVGLSVVISCDLSHESEFMILREFSIATETPLFIVECIPGDETKMEDFRRIKTLSSYDVGDTPKLFVNVSTRFDDIKKFMPHILHSFSIYSKEWSKIHTKEPEIKSCYTHYFELGNDYRVSGGDICNRCSKQLSTPILKCLYCGYVLHKTCTELPSIITIAGWLCSLTKYGDNKKVRCDCCNEVIKDYAYTLSKDGSSICLDLNCLFTAPLPGTNLHEHPMELHCSNPDFKCGACGFICKQKLRYRCIHRYCPFEIGIKCGFLKETVTFGRHRHPFHLEISPEHVSNQYYCEVCQEERDKKHWTYCCVGCEFFIHIHCLVPTGGCPILEL